MEVLENLAYLANASNLVLYLSRFMHFSPSSSANIVTNFMGTAFLLAHLGGFLSDAYFTTYRIYLISAMTEFLVRIGPSLTANITQHVYSKSLILILNKITSENISYSSAKDVNE